MKYKDTIVNKPDYAIEKGVIEIPYEIICDKNDPTSFTGSGKLGKKMSLISQAETKEDLKDKMQDAFNASISMYETESSLLMKRAIWLSNFSNRGNGFAFWFSIIGLGLNLVYNSDRKWPLLNRDKKPIKFIGISSAGGLVIKNLIIFPINNWRKKKTDESK
jgi:hypothetical protein